MEFTGHTENGAFGAAVPYRHKNGKQGVSGETVSHWRNGELPTRKGIRAGLIKLAGFSPERSKGFDKLARGLIRDYDPEVLEEVYRRKKTQQNGLKEMISNAGFDRKEFVAAVNKELPPGIPEITLQIPARWSREGLVDCEYVPTVRVVLKVPDNQDDRFTSLYERTMTNLVRVAGEERANNVMKSSLTNIPQR